MNETRNIVLAAALLVSPALAADQTPLTPDFPALMNSKEIAAWDFATPEKAWQPLNHATVRCTNGAMVVSAAGNDAQLRVPSAPLKGPLVLRWKSRGSAQGPTEIFWAGPGHPDMAANGSVRIPLTSDGKWHTNEIVIGTREVVSVIRFDPCTAEGTVEIADAHLTQREIHPLQFERLETEGNKVRGAIRNTTDRKIAFKISGRGFEAEAGGSVPFETSAASGRAFTAFRITAEADGLPPLERTIHLHDPDARLDSTDFGNSNVLVRVARDRSGARILWKGRLAAIATPLVDRMEIRVEGDDVLFDGSAAEGLSSQNIRVVGPMFQGLLSGVEYLGKGEESSTKLDVERAEHVRFEPNRDWITMPLAAYVSDLSSVALLWDDHALQPVFSTPNRYDSTPDHLMGLKGGALQFRLHLGDGFERGGRLEDAILWAVKKRGLPEPPEPPRTPDQQRALCLSALNGPLRTSNGWYHATWEGQPQHFFVDHASTLFRLTGKMPEVPRLENTGAHVANPAAWLVSGRAGEWLAILQKDASHARNEQKPDGSFRYEGKFQRGHFETTASGLCAIMALHLLDHARYTGDAASRDAGVKALEYMRKFVTPRGAQTWEIPLHTPDILGAADACRAYVRGYELTGRADFLDLARRWAVRGLPFVYQWERQPVMRYGTIAVLGATDWTGVVWIGLPVQWCGTVYAYALTELAVHDRSLDWNRVALGILNCAEQMQYPDGAFAGTLPDSFNLQEQRRLPAYVNPCVIVALQLRLEGQLDAVDVAANGQHRVASPFPVRLEGGRAVVQGRAGLKYQVVVDGTRVIDVESKGRDEIEL